MFFRTTLVILYPWQNIVFFFKVSVRMQNVKMIPFYNVTLNWLNLKHNIEYSVSHLSHSVQLFYPKHIFVNMHICTRNIWELTLIELSKKYMDNYYLIIDYILNRMSLSLSLSGVSMDVFVLFFIKYGMKVIKKEKSISLVASRNITYNNSFAVLMSDVQLNLNQLGFN